MTWVVQRRRGGGIHTNWVQVLPASFFLFEAAVIAAYAVVPVGSDLRDYRAILTLARHGFSLLDERLLWIAERCLLCTHEYADCQCTGNAPTVEWAQHKPGREP